MECSALSAGDDPSVRPEFFGGVVILGRTMTRQPRLVPVIAFDLTPPFSALRISASANSVRRVVRPCAAVTSPTNVLQVFTTIAERASRATTKKADNYFSVAIL